MKDKFGRLNVSRELNILRFFAINKNNKLKTQISYANHDSEGTIWRKTLLPRNLRPFYSLSPINLIGY